MPELAFHTQGLHSLGLFFFLSCGALNPTLLCPEGVKSIQRRPETMHQVDSGGTSSPGVHARNEHHEANKVNGSCANQG